MSSLQRWMYAHVRVFSIRLQSCKLRTLVQTPLEGTQANHIGHVVTPSWAGSAWIMAITLHVSLLSGKTVSVQAELDTDVETVKQYAQSALSVQKGNRGRLLASDGTMLDGAKTLILGGCSGTQTQLPLLVTTPYQLLHIKVCQLFILICLKSNQGKNVV